MGFMSWLSGSVEANPDVRKSTVGELRDAMLAVNSTALPWQVCSGGEDGPDLIAGWKGGDPQWQPQFDIASMDTNLRVLMRFDFPTHTVRSVDRSLVVGGSFMAASASYSRGQLNDESISMSFGRRPDGSFGQLSGSRFNVSDIKIALKGVALQNGWSWKGILFTRL
jgi:hypothetical protein